MDGVPTPNGLPDPELAWTKPSAQVLTQLRNMVYYNGQIELLSRYPTYTTAVSGKTMSALTVMRDMQSRPWTAAIGSDALPPPNADLKRFYEQGVLEFLTSKRDLTRANWTAWVQENRQAGWTGLGSCRYRQGQGIRLPQVTLAVAVMPLS
ncbi:MAG: hypothetical protein U5R30_11065 [Deltaproteobacteria bacterium]|nr:hypothetical protein [Deltaproteobacteria bacterium]